ncbi:alpha/beta fold hydrolase [Paenarthrobacter sp. Z7-10]|uniref:alpha/beta fold hydrolase n=1 Tax=Paenarthrobacter sp. Z7-10 TaxID=2787635 RepID=UPI0022A9029E|nr:alpha/beta hydrolase [Paenarthrobacter sp. Z7-10]
MMTSPATPEPGPDPLTASDLHRRMFPTPLGEVAVRLSAAASSMTDKGSSTATVYLHGAAGSWTTFIPLLAAQTATAQRHTVLLDLPGWGESAQGFDASELSLPAMAAAVTDILRALGYRRWNLVGHSMGGFLALHMAATDPQHTAGVVVISATTFGVAQSAREPVRGLFRFPAFTGMLLVMRAMAALGRPGQALVRSIGRTSLMRLLMAPFFAMPAAVSAEVLRNLGSDARPAAFAAAARISAHYDFGGWRGIRCPVLAIRGDNDVFTPASDLDRLTGLVPHATGLTIPGCGHFANIEKPAALNELLTHALHAADHEGTQLL